MLVKNKKVIIENVKPIKKSGYPYQVLIVDLLIFFFSFFIYVFIARRLFTQDSVWTQHVSIYFFIPILLILIFGLGFPIYIERRHNHLKLKNFFLYLGIALAFFNIIAIAILPNQIYFPTSDVTYELTIGVRIYSFFCGCVIGFMPYVFFYLIPRRVRYQKYIVYILFASLIVLGVFVIISFFTDGENYLYLLQNGFGDFHSHCVEGLFSKTTFGQHYCIGVYCVILLDIITHNWKWLLLFIPIAGFQIFTIAKMPIGIAWLAMLIYLVYKLIKRLRQMKKSRDNLVILISVISFIVIMLSVGIVLMVNSQSGVLFKIKTFIVEVANDAKATWISRTHIWRDVFACMNPAQYIFGYSYGLGGVFTHYATILGEGHWHAHSAVVEMMTNGGIIFVLINYLLDGYLIYIAAKIHKKHPDFLFITVLFVLAQILHGLTEPTFILNDNTDFLLNFVMVVPVMAIYYMYYDQDEVKVRKEIVQQAAQIKKQHFDRRLLRLNQKALIHSAKMIESEEHHV